MDTDMMVSRPTVPSSTEIGDVTTIQTYPGKSIHRTWSVIGVVIIFIIPLYCFMRPSTDRLPAGVYSVYRLENREWDNAGSGEQFSCSTRVRKITVI